MGIVIQKVLGFMVYNCVLMDTYITRDTCKNDMLTINNKREVGAVKSDSIHHFFRNACTKSGPLRFPSFPIVD